MRQGAAALARVESIPAKIVAELAMNSRRFMVAPKKNSEGHLSGSNRDCGRARRYPLGVKSAVFGCRPITSDPPPTPDILAARRHVSKVPGTEVEFGKTY
jgi:hypothetical protein